MQEPDTKAPVLARIAATRDCFNDLEAVRRRAVVVAATHSKNRPAELRAIAQTVKSYDVPRGLTVEARKVINELISAAEEAQSSKKPIVLSNFRRFVQAIRTEHKKAKARLLEIDSATADQDLQTLYDRAQKIIKETQREQKNLDSLTNKPWAIARVPVIPIIKNGFNIPQAERQGLQVDNLGGYLMLRNQMVVGIARLEKGQKPLDAVQELLPLLIGATGRKLTLVSNKGARYKGNLWYWIADDHTLNALRKSAIGSLQINDWGFGFSGA